MPIQQVEPAVNKPSHDTPTGDGMRPTSPGALSSPSLGRKPPTERPQERGPVGKVETVGRDHFGKR